MVIKLLLFTKRLMLIFVLVFMLFILYFILVDIANVLTPIPLDPFRSLKGGSWLGYRLGYYGTLLLVISMSYSVVKRLNPNQTKKFGGNRFWLSVHIWLAIIGSLMVLVHAGFPFDFRYYDPFKYVRLASGGVAGLVGFAGLATLIIPFALGSGFIGRYLFKRTEGGVKAVFRYWHVLHIILTGALYVTGVIHLILIVWFRFVTL